MIIVDAALERRETDGNPVKIAIVGAGNTGKMLTRQFLKPLTGMRLAAVVNRTLSEAERAYGECGVESVRVCETARDMEAAVAAGQPAISDDPAVACGAGPIDVIVEVTGTVDYGAHVAMQAIQNGKHIVLVNADVDATLGPILKRYADRAGVVYTNIDGDEPGVAMNLVRFARGIGYTPVCAGNIKGMIDHYRNPETQREFAAKYNQKPAAVASFADGTKLYMETTVLANAAGLRVAKRGMHGHACAHVNDTLKLFTMDDFAEGALVEYIIGAAPHTGAFVLAHTEDPVDQSWMNYFKMGDGPFYCFYTPYHLPQHQMVTSVARAALFHDATVAPMGKPQCDVITMAKRDLRVGDILDGSGGFCSYGMIENAAVSLRDRCLPMGLSPDCRVLRALPKDHPLTYGDVEMPNERLADRLRREQDELFFPEFAREQRISRAASPDLVPA